MCSRTSARRDRRSAMMFHYIDYADTAVRTRNRQRAGGGEDRERGRKGTRGTGQGETERAVATNKHRQKERREMGASTEERSECKHEREDMRDGEREVKQGGVCVCVCVQATAGRGIPRANCQCSGAP